LVGRKTEDIFGIYVCHHFSLSGDGQQPSEVWEENSIMIEEEEVDSFRRDMSLRQIKNDEGEEEEEANSKLKQ